VQLVDEHDDSASRCALVTGMGFARLARRRVGGQVTAELVERGVLDCLAGCCWACSAELAAISSRAQVSQTSAPRLSAPSDATTRTVPRRRPQTAQAPPETAKGDWV